MGKQNSKLFWGINLEKKGFGPLSVSTWETGPRFWRWDHINV